MSEVLAIIQWDQAYNRNGNSKLPRAAMNVLRTYMNNHTLSGWVSQETIAQDTGMTVRNVRKQLAANVAAGWLEIVESGNSSKATVYRLTYPDRVPQDTVTTTETVSESSRSTSEGCPTGHGNRVPQFTPTTPRTSPKEKFYMSTTPGTGNSGSPFGEPDLPDHGDQDETGQESRSLADAGSATADGRGRGGPSHMEPATADLTPEERLLGEILAEGSVGSKSDLPELMGVSIREVNVIIPRMIADGLIIHDTDREYPALILA